MLHFFEPIALVRPGRAIDVPRFIEIPSDPSPSVSRKALLETRARATPADRFPQAGADLGSIDARIAGCGVRAQSRRASGARVALVFRAAYVAHSRCRLFRRIVAAPRANRAPLGSSMPHDRSCSTIVPLWPARHRLAGRMFVAHPQALGRHHSPTPLANGSSWSARRFVHTERPFHERCRNLVRGRRAVHGRGGAKRRRKRTLHRHRVRLRGAAGLLQRGQRSCRSTPPRPCGRGQAACPAAGSVLERQRRAVRPDSVQRHERPAHGCARGRHAHSRWRPQLDGPAPALRARRAVGERQLEARRRLGGQRRHGRPSPGALEAAGLRRWRVAP